MALISTAVASAAVAAGLAVSTIVHAQEATPKQLLESYLAEFGRGNIEALVEAHAPDAVFITPQGTFVGRDQIRGLITAVANEFGLPGARFSADGLYPAGNAVLFIWTGETAVATYGFAAETYVFVDGKIAVHTFSASVSPKAAVR